MKILSIETSCDETAIAVLEISGPVSNPEIQVLGNTLMSQVALHEQYGGVFPMLAKREHEKNLPTILEKTLEEARNKSQDTDLPGSVDYIAVTAGPGLEPALWAGITFAEELGRKWSKPVIPVNHMLGHVFSVLYGQGEPLALPAIALLVSGGHTELVLVKDFQNYEILGRTLDDAVGEAFDKVARMLSLAYPGGPKISHLAARSRERSPEPNFKLPRPMLHSGDLNFSYSGLKTAVLYKLKSDAKSDNEYKEDIARAFEDAAIDVLIQKTRTALESTEHDIKTLIVGGGVAANQYLREKLLNLVSNLPHITLRLPDNSLTTDNAIMIALAAYVETSTNPDLLERRDRIIAKGNQSYN